MNTLDVCNACLVAIHYGDTSWAYPYEDDSRFYRCAICDQMTDTYEVSQQTIRDDSRALGYSNTLGRYCLAQTKAKPI